MARTLLRDRLDWTLRQKSTIADLAVRFAAAVERLGLLKSLTTQMRKEARPMVAGVTQFPSSVADNIEQKLGSDPALKKQWEEVSARFRFVFADPEAAFRAMNFEAILTDKEIARQALQRLGSDPASIGPLKGKAGLLASKSDSQARRVAGVNVPALKRDIERYLQMRENAVQRIESDEKTLRQRVSIDIPALSDRRAHV